MTGSVNRQILLKSRPEGAPRLDNFEAPRLKPRSPSAARWHRGGRREAGSTANVLEINVNALWTSGLELVGKIAGAMIETSIEAQLASDEATLFSAADDANGMAPFDFGDLPDY